MDKASLSVNNNMWKNITMWMQSTECFECPLVAQANIAPGTSWNTTIDTTFHTAMNITMKKSDGTNALLCSRTFMFRESSNYKYFVSPNASDLRSEANCLLVFDVENWDCMTPLYISFGILIGLLLLFLLVQFMYRRRLFHKLLFCASHENQLVEDLGTPSLVPSVNEEILLDRLSASQSVTPMRNRLRSLDAFRGLALLLMIFVNYGGGGYWFFRHSFWNGLTVADLVFPWFIFIIGTSMAMAFKRMHRGEVTRLTMLRKVVVRSAILILMGIMLNSHEHDALSTLRLPGVLQRIGVTYLLMGLMEIVFCKPAISVRSGVMANGLESTSELLPDSWRPSPMADMRKLWPYWLVILALIGVHCGVTFGVYVPGCGRGYLGPGGLHEGGKWINCTGGAAGWLDRVVFSSNHIYQRPTCRHVYHCNMPYDPEGLLGCLTSLVLCFFGLMAGKIFLIFTSWFACVKRFIIWFLITFGIGLLLCECSWNEGWIPINKNLWSLSYVFVNAGGCFLLLALLYLLIDVLGLWSGKPFFYPGMNSIFIYICHEVFEQYFPVSWSVTNSHSSLLAMNIWGTVFWAIVSYGLHKKGIFINI